MTIREVQESVDQWIRKYGVRYFDELTNTAILMEEVGEFARIMARKFGEQSFKDQQDAEGADAKIADEMADIVFVLMCMANQMDIDLERALTKNLRKKTERDQNRHRKNPKLKP